MDAPDFRVESCRVTLASNTRNSTTSKSHVDTNKILRSLFSGKMLLRFLAGRSRRLLTGFAFFCLM